MTTITAGAPVTITFNEDGTINVTVDLTDVADMLYEAQPPHIARRLVTAWNRHQPAAAEVQS